MPRYLGIDCGQRRIGLAISDAEGRMSSPLKQIEASGSATQDAHSLSPVIRDYNVDVLVVGLPLNMADGQEGPQAQAIRRYAEKLASVLNLPVEFWDERLSSQAADELLLSRGHMSRQGQKSRRDALAAHVILQGYLDHLQS